MSNVIIIEFDDERDRNEVLRIFNQKIEMTWENDGAMADKNKHRKAMIKTFRKDGKVIVSKSVHNFPASPIRL